MRPAERFLTVISKTFFLVTALALFVLAAGLVAVAVHDVYTALYGEALLEPILRSIGLLTIAVAVFEVAKFLLEEEIIRERELRSITDVRLSLTKFFTIVVIVLSLEGIVLVFEVKLEELDRLIYPTALMAVAILALVGLGLFRRLTDPSAGTADLRQAEERRAQGDSEASKAES
jgi:tellurite resistance protein TehA-like permease